MFFGSGHVSAMLASLRSNRRKRPNMRLELDYRSRQGIKNVEYKKTKKLTAKEIAQIRLIVAERNKHRVRNQLLFLALSLVLLGLILWGFLLLVNWFAAQPADIYNPNAR